MRTARTLFASAVITAVFAVTAPTALASSAAEGRETDGGYSASSYRHDEHRRGDDDHRWGRHHHKCRHHHHRRHHHRHYRPIGGIHTGGGAMAHSFR
ncbi:hypothetical protein ACFXN2_27295 [Streptomyces kronopolitis]|uniref:Uncharacterized protein n=1 Tax=Streptomyces kronopolitis TaxID=1612435 RepID=A0ABQ2JR27_9ACTN|nr:MULTISPECIES: hypothetical protein [Streptomyces]MCL6301968.1 hypothetical protein [Streptomyces kronopolitis]GGN54709.1 hypothetical protein GCM10012285_47830 [Streptomyces kronopolitis]GLW16626.1 hypothetical protein Stsp01_33690 [Streptomyces sp. NBRC 13847]